MSAPEPIRAVDEMSAFFAGYLAGFAGMPEPGSANSRSFWNGWTNEALLAVLIHRTKILDGQYPSTFNKLAIDNMSTALLAFNERTASRVSRGVEGTHQV